MTPRKPGAAVAIGVVGARELIRNFERLPVNMQKRVVRSAVSKVARKLVKVVKSNIGEGSTKAIDSGLLQKSIGFRAWTSKSRRWVVGATIGPRKGFATLVQRNKKGKLKALTKRGIARVVERGDTFSRSQYVDPARYGHLPELGTKARSKRGQVRGVHFMQYSLIRSRDSLEGTLRTAVHEGLEREAARLTKAASYGR